MRHVSHRVGWFAPAIVSVLVLGLGSADERDPLAPIDTGMVERTGVSLILLDVEVTDEDGSPIPGLGLEDFTVRLNGRRWPVETVDDLCSCAEGPAATSLAEEVATAEDPVDKLEPDAPAVGGRPPSETVRFVLYLDYGQLQPAGRAMAVAEAERWVRETMHPEDEVMVAAWASSAGLRVLSGFTSDKRKLLAAIDESNRAPEFVDPFPTLRWERQRECARCCSGEDPYCDCSACQLQASREEHSQGRHSLQALGRLLERLEREPGRKALLLFHQNGTLFPARYYGASDERGGDHIRLLDRIAADATLSRTAIYTAFSGPGPDRFAVNLGANLADYTGGGYNRSQADLSVLVDRAGRGCACTYRLGLAPPEDSGRQVYRVLVEVGGRALAGRWRVQYLDDGERWMRAARSVLSDPTQEAEIPVAAALVPASENEGGWSVKVQVALPADSIALLPAGGKQRGNWEVGALLADRKARRTWEMLGISELRRESDGKTATAILHEHVIDGLRPGEYELRAFVRDRVTRAYGGAIASIELPDAKRRSIGGPLLLRAESPLLLTSLPLLTKRGGDRSPATTGEMTRGSVPLGAGEVLRGEPLEFHSWLCPDGDKKTIYETDRHVSLDGEPVFRFEGATIVAAGGCTAIRDDLDTRPMSSGVYTYHLDWTGGSDGSGSSILTFTINEPPFAPPAAPSGDAVE